MGKSTACKKCGGTTWVEYELRKLGLVILGGVPCMSTHFIIQPVRFLRCPNCGEILNSDKSRVAIGEASREMETIKSN